MGTGSRHIERRRAFDFGTEITRRAGSYPALLFDQREQRKKDHPQITEQEIDEVETSFREELL